VGVGRTLAGEVGEDGLHLGGRGLGGVQGQVRDGWRGEVQEGGAETRCQGGGQRALAGGRRAADQDGGESVQGRASAVAAVGLSGSDGSSRAW
jgi:hypothetical protein